MAEKYLTDKTLFQCTMSAAPVPFTCSGSKKAAVIAEGNLLTTSASGNPPAGTLCKSPAKAIGGAPQPCTPQLLQWCNASRVCTVEGRAVLTEKSFKQCQFGGRIKVSRNPSRKVMTGASSVSAAPQQGTPASPSGGKAGMGSFSTAAATAGAVAVGTTPGMPSPGAAVSAGGAAKAAEVEKAAPKPADDNAILTGMLCSGDCSKEQREQCGYFLDHQRRQDSQVTVDNQSKLLAENYAAATQKEACRDDIDEQYYDLRKRYGTRYWSYAAHHIISGNQVFKQLTELVRLADFLHYDINNAQNCIYLVSKEEGYGQIASERRNISAYEAMSLAELQWHQGGHQYSFSRAELPKLRALVARKLGKPGEIRCYADLLQEELADLAAEIRQEQRCWHSKNPQQQKEMEDNFAAKLNGLARSVRQKLGAFKQKPAASYPYYVSKEAYRYAFTLPRTGKLIIVRREASGDLVLHKYRLLWPAERQQEENGLDRLQLKPVQKDGGKASYRLPPQASAAQMKKCIVFCENVVHFLFVNEDFTRALPFTPEFSLMFTANTLEEQASDEALLAEDKRQTELRTWLREAKQEHYQAPLTLIHRRQQEWEAHHGT